MSRSSPPRQQRTQYIGQRSHASRASRKEKPVVPPPAWLLNGSSLGQAYVIPGVAILPLRLFLGVTFVYAGWQKLTDPGFMRLGSSTYIGTQLLGFSRGSPIHFLLSPMLEHAQLFGGLVIVTEIAIGLLVLAGLFTRPAAIVGLCLNLILFLSATWHVYPYFLGSDIVFVVAWLTLALTGPGAFALDGLLKWPLPGHWRQVITGPMDTAKATSGATAAPAPGSAPISQEHTDTPPVADSGMNGPFTRREALVGALATLAVVVLGLLPRTTASSGKLSPTTGSGGSSGASKPSKSGGTASPPPNGQKVGNVSQLSVNSAIATTDPKSGDPAVVVCTAKNQYFAYDAVCTHAGCTVEYDQGYKLLVCPCHGGAFDPAHGANVVAGPPPSPLAQLPLTIDAQGNIYLT